MPQFFFHVHDGIATIDREGVELSTAELARGEAALCASEMLRERGWSNARWQMCVTNEEGEAVCRISFLAERDGLDAAEDSNLAFADTRIRPHEERPVAYSTALGAVVETLSLIEFKQATSPRQTLKVAASLFCESTISAITARLIAERTMALREIFSDFIQRRSR